MMNDLKFTDEEDVLNYKKYIFFPAKDNFFNEEDRANEVFNLTHTLPDGEVLITSENANDLPHYECRKAYRQKCYDEGIYLFKEDVIFHGIGEVQYRNKNNKAVWDYVFEELYNPMNDNGDRGKMVKLLQPNTAFFYKFDNDVNFDLLGEGWSRPLVLELEDFDSKGHYVVDDNCRITFSPNGFFEIIIYKNTIAIHGHALDLSAKLCMNKINIDYNRTPKHPEWAENKAMYNLVEDYHAAYKFALKTIYKQKYQ